MKTLLLIRHTETEYLAKAPSSRLSNDAVLSDAGRTHARKLMQELSSYSVDLVASSLYRRSQQTAEILNAHWQAKSCATAALNEYFLREDGSGVESVEEGFVRVSQFINPLRLTFNTVAVVSHNSILSTYLTGLLNLPFQEGKDLFAKLGATYVLEYDWERGDQNWTVKKTIAGV